VPLASCGPQQSFFQASPSVPGVQYGAPKPAFQAADRRRTAGLASAALCSVTQGLSGLSPDVMRPLSCVCGSFLEDGNALPRLGFPTDSVHSRNMDRGDLSTVRTFARPLVHRRALGDLGEAQGSHDLSPSIELGAGGVRACSLFCTEYNTSTIGPFHSNFGQLSPFCRPHGRQRNPGTALLLTRSGAQFTGRNLSVVAMGLCRAREAAGQQRDDGNMTWSSSERVSSVDSKDKTCQFSGEIHPNGFSSALQPRRSMHVAAYRWLLQSQGSRFAHTTTRYIAAPL
jgi:hypothetical protein